MKHFLLLLLVIKPNVINDQTSKTFDLFSREDFKLMKKKY